MSIFDHLFDSEYAQRNDINALKEAVTAYDPTPQRVAVLERRVNQLQLLVSALGAIIEHKNVATREELEVLVQQVDLLDGREDGVQSRDVWQKAPRCEGCNHFVNPTREACIYCGRSRTASASGGGAYRGGPPEAAARTATCGHCAATVPQNETFFTDEGELWCSSCYRE